MSKHTSLRETWSEKRLREYREMRTAIHTVVERARVDSAEGDTTYPMLLVEELLPFVDDSAETRWEDYHSTEVVNPWAGITPQMALRAAVKLHDSHGSGTSAMIIEALAKEPDRIRELAEEE